MYIKALPKLYIVQNMLELLIKAKLNCCGLVPYVFLGFFCFLTQSIISGMGYYKKQ